MTLMVRDEADIVGAMLAHHRNQGVDHVIVTDNGSIDGTTEILEQFVEQGFVTLWHDPVHRKQQWSAVTKMARFAASELGADWVINADADEFFVPVDASRTVRQVLRSVPADIPYVTVPVINLTGSPARDGSGFDRLRYRDRRDEKELHAAGIPFHPTADAVHRGNAEVEISQGNHFVSAPGWAKGTPSVDLEVLHLPWRSWRQYRHKVRVSGEAYESNPELAPSPRHHGMQDFRRLKGGRLEAAYVSKHPRADEIDPMLARGSLVRDDRLAFGVYHAAAGARSDVAYDEAALSGLASQGRAFAALEAESESRLLTLREDQAREREVWLVARGRLQYFEARTSQLEEELVHRTERLQSEIAALRARKLIRFGDWIAGLRRSGRGS